MNARSHTDAAILEPMADATFVSARPQRAPAKLSAVPYMPGLDGMRAIAVIAVMLYHANHDWLPGGFLGVEVFFVISGYLITLLLMAEREETGHIRLLAFWGRRARRLLPALFVMLFLVLTYTMMFKSSVLGKLRGDLVAAVFYVTNWYQIWVGQGYTSGSDFVPLRHLWSLAVEEQFYLVWPVVMMLLMRRGGTRRLAMTARWLVIAALGITIATALLYNSGRIGECSVTPDAYWTVGNHCLSKMDALYLSTITRSTGVLLGAAFAMVWRPRAIMRSALRDRPRMLDLVAIGGLALLGVQFWFLTVASEDGVADPWLFRGGFLVTAAATLAMIAAVTHRYTITSRVLAMRPLLWVGTRSYGLYLFHWPIYQMIRGIAGKPLSWQQFLLAMAITVPITELSYHFLEMPIRKRQFAAWWDGLRRRRNPAPRQAMAFTVVACLLLLAIGVIRLGLAEVNPNEVEASLQAGAEQTTSLEELLGNEGASPGTSAAPAPTETTQPADGSLQPSTSLGTTTTSTTTTTTTTTLPSEPVDYLAIGDSVMLGAAGVLSDRGYTVDAHVSRQMIDMIPIMQQFGEADLFGDPVVIHLGTNGPFDAETLDALLAPLSSVPNVILINVFANRSWTASNNALLDARDQPGDNIILLDWFNLAPQCPGNCFASDGIHLNATGQKYYADMIGDITGK
jgi:peptidoglycan/LPS O-acetylase OafA/YrhL